MNKLFISCVALISFAIASTSKADFLVEGFTATDADTNGSSIGFGFKVLSDISISGLSYVDFGSAGGSGFAGLKTGLTVSLSRHLEGNTAGAARIASIDFEAGSGADDGTGGGAGTFYPDNSGVFNATTEVPSVEPNGFWYKLFADQTAGLNAGDSTVLLEADNGSGTDYIYILFVEDVLNSSTDSIFQDVLAGSGQLSNDIDIDATQFQLLTSFEATGDFATGNNNTGFGLQSTSGIPVFNDNTSGIPGGDPDFNPVGPNFVFADLTPPEPEPMPGVPEPSSLILAGLGLVCGLFYIRRRSAVTA